MSPSVKTAFSKSVARATASRNSAPVKSLFANAPLNTDDRPVIEYMAPQTQQRAVGRQVAWLTDDALLELLDDLRARTPPESDPYLCLLTDDQLAYVNAGRMLYEVGVRVNQGRGAEMAPVYREFLSIVPFDIYPGLSATR